MSAAGLRKIIHDAFAGTRPPDTSEIVPKHEYVHLECDEIREAFHGKAWDELSLPFLTYHREAVFFFTPRAWSYYLPAYMQAIITDYDGTDTMVNGLLATLAASRDADDEARRRARIAALNGRQRAALGKFIDWVASEHSDDLEEEDRQAIRALLEQRSAGW